ncbi:gibberellin-regulated protein 6-like [Asparagus officinalis]|uniref:gibberellin-regulated protein 6-like n=1 Tax=Asparagus officinalis TaxID=4686 RepID=UPI00098E5557|nr:gibberellin-regulated protein 6-like [Asparagus officinalis]
MAMVKLLVLLAIALFVIMMAESSLATPPVTAGGEYHLDRAGSGYGPGSLKSYQCQGQCNRRCSRTQYKKPCLFFCNKCCAKCLCVPPGFYGNKGVCPCYNNWKTKEGGPKCP